MPDWPLLSSHKVEEFVNDGYTVIRNVIPLPLVERALKSINQQIGEGIDRDDLLDFRAAGYFPDLAASKAITDLVNETAICSYVETLTGGKSILPVKRGQIALRFPTFDLDLVKIHCHLDGQWGKFEGVRVEDFGADFSVLVYVMLRDIRELDCGNFSVVPKTHILYERHFRKHGTDAFLKGMRKVESGPPIQITGMAGDVALVHYQLAHGPAPNFSANIRYAVFFRLKNSARDSHKSKALTNIWLDFPAIGPIVQVDRK